MANIEQLIEQANKKALEIIQNGQPTLVDVSTAGEAIPGMTKKSIFHAGPPCKWENMSGPLKGAIMGALVYEGLAKDAAEAEKLAASGEIEFGSCHEHSSVGPMAGVTSYSMPVWVLQNKAYGNYSYCNLNEGLGKALRFGAFGPEVIERLKWMEKILGPVLKEAIKLHGPYDLKTMIAQMIQMGDEGHNRNKAGTSLFIREFAPYVVETSFSQKDKIDVLKFMNGNDHFVLNLTMPAAKCTLEAAKGIKYSTIVYTMSRNGTEFGIRVSGLGDRWFTAQANYIKGLYFPGFSEKDANRDIGDSCITETCSYGGFAMAAAPAIVLFVGGTPKDAINYSTSMYEITTEENKMYNIPALNFRGTPTGIDIRKVVETGILPIINTGMAHKDPGVGQVGAGLVNPPMKCFEDALEAFVEELEKEGLA